MFAIVPVKTMVASPVPSPVVKVRPAMPESVSVPLLEVSVTLTAPETASTSPMLIALPLPAENTSVVSSLVLCAMGTVLTGASLTALTVMLTVSLSVFAPPSPVFPRSLVVICTVAAPL